MPHAIRTLVFGLLVGLGLAAPVAAQTPSTLQQLSELRVGLQHYDVEANGTLRLIERLAELSRRAPRRQADEAQFLRVVATVDLVLIARRRRDDSMLELIAEAFGTSTSELDGALRSELEELRHEPYVETIDDALAALAPRDEVLLPLPEGEQPRLQAVVFSHAFDQVVRAEDPTTALARLAADPCGADSECAPPYDRFGPHGRRAVAAMTALHSLLRSIERTAALGDPFSAALAREVLVDAVVLRSIALTPRDWARNVRPAGALERGAPLDVDAVIVVSRERVRAGWVPEVLWDTEGRPSLSADGPLLGSPDEASVPIAAAADAFVRPIPELAAHVAIGIRGAARVALLVEPDVEAHFISRVLVSLEAADIRPELLAVAAEDGTARGVAFQTVQDDAGPVGVFVRLGGFSAWQRGQHVSLPRQRTAQRWEFDYEGLDVATRERVRHPVTLRFMGTVAADIVLRAALRLASVDRPLRLVVPTANPEG